MQQQLQQAAVALAAVPDAVRKYIVLFYQAVQNGAVPEISNAYEGNWNRLTEKFYSKAEWPEAEVIAPLVNDGELADLAGDTAATATTGARADLHSLMRCRTNRPKVLDSLPRAVVQVSLGHFYGGFRTLAFFSQQYMSLLADTSTRASLLTARTASTHMTTTATSSTLS